MKPDPPDEPDHLIEAVARGDRVAFEHLYDRYSPLVYSLSLRIIRVRADAEDLVQEVFLQVWRRAGTYRLERGGAEVWLLTIARNLALDRYRAADTMKRFHQSLRGTAPAPLAGPKPGKIHRDESGSAIRSALAKLADEQRRVLELAYFDGLSQSRIATELGVPLGTVKTRIRSGMERLGWLLAKGEMPEGRG